jgi:hypothetical protein
MTRITDNLHENLFTFMTVCRRILIPVDARPKAWVCGRSFAGIAGSNPAGDMGVSLLLGIFSASGWSHVQRNPTERGVSECNQEASIMRRPLPTRDCCAMGGGGSRLFFTLRKFGV